MGASAQGLLVLAGDEAGTRGCAAGVRAEGRQPRGLAPRGGSSESQSSRQSLPEPRAAGDQQGPVLPLRRRQSLRRHSLLSPPITESYVAATRYSVYCILMADISPPPSTPVVGPHAVFGLYKLRGRPPAQAGPGGEAFGQGPSAEQDWPGCATRSNAPESPWHCPGWSWPFREAPAGPGTALPLLMEPCASWSTWCQLRCPLPTSLTPLALFLQSPSCARMCPAQVWMGARWLGEGIGQRG